MCVDQCKSPLASTKEREVLFLKLLKMKGARAAVLGPTSNWSGCVINIAQLCGAGSEINVESKETRFHHFLSISVF